MMKKYPVILFFIAFFFRIGVFAQDPAVVWLVPQEDKEKVCSFPFTPETVKSGESVYQKNCKSCHGDPGKKNMAKIVPQPQDPASDEFQAQTDGEMFFKVKVGKAPMPQFGSILSEEERWHVISYIRSFNAGYVQPVAVVKTGKGNKNLKISMYCNYRQKKLYVLCKELTAEKSELPAKGIDIQLNVRRYFGILKVGEPKTTNASGLALFSFPSDLPGGPHGILDLTAKVSDESGLISSNQARAMLAIGRPVVLKSLTDAHAMWSIRSKAPLWLILTFSLSVIAVWGFIFYILFSLKQLKEIQ